MFINLGIKQLFESIDLDGNGTITVDELLESLKRRGHIVSCNTIIIIANFI